MYCIVLREMPCGEIVFNDLDFYESLGRGGSGNVYRALWKSKQRVVAAKRLVDDPNKEVMVFN